VREYCGDVREGAFPSDSESYHMPRASNELKPARSPR